MSQVFNQHKNNLTQDYCLPNYTILKTQFLILSKYANITHVLRNEHNNLFLQIQTFMKHITANTNQNHTIETKFGH